MKKLLIIDDEPLILAGIRSMLDYDALGLEVCGVANNGKAGLDIIETEDPDIVITDIKMPVMTGIDLLKFVREKKGPMRPAFIILTSYEDFSLAKETISYNIIDYLVKLELTPDILKKSINKALSMLESVAPDPEAENKPNDLKVLKDKFFIRLLHNLFDSEDQMNILQKDLSIDLDYDGFQCIYFEMKNEKFESMPVEKQVHMYSNSYNMICELIAKYVKIYPLTLDRRHGVILLLIDEKNHDSLIINDILNNINETLINYYGTGIVCGIGNYTEKQFGISDSYTNARKAFTAVRNGEVSADYEDFLSGDDSHAVFNINLFKDDLVRAYSEYNPEILKEITDDLSALFAEHKEQYVQALDGACNVLFLGLSLMPDGEDIISNIYANVPDGYRSIYRQKNTDEIISWLTHYTESLSAVFEARKKEHRNHIVSNVKKYIDANLTEKLSLNEVSALYGISPNYLSSLFKKYSDIGYTEYITKKKIEKAKKLMEEGNLKVYEIADMLGFESSFYFSKVFKKIEGVSPSEYINRI